MRPSRVVRTCSLLAPVALLAGCPTAQTPTGPTDARLKRFESPDALLGYFRDQAVETNSTTFFFGRGGLSPTFAEDNAVGGPAGDDGGQGDAGGDGDFTGTNLQEAGVDESDFFKFDGTHMYVARDRSIRVVRAVPLADLAELARVDLDEPIGEMFLSGDRLIVFSQGFAYGGGAEPGFAGDLIWPPYYPDAALTITAIDISDPANPVVAESVELDGSLVSARITDGRLVLVMTVQPDVPEPATALSLLTLSLDQVLPAMTVGGEVHPIVAWSDWYRPDSPDGYQMTAVVTLDADDVTQVLGSTAVMAGAGTIYASTEAVYVTNTQYDYAGNAREYTDLHKFAYDADGVARYVGSGQVPGRLLNQFSLGEHDGYLRVATHVQNFAFADDVADAPVGIGGGTAADGGDNAVSTQQTRVAGPYNAVYVLGENGDELEVVGQIEDIAPGERLYAARFMGPRGFLVTFVQVDPLFTLDLADPTAPAIRGELKIPGFSDYLHVFNENYLIGVGRATEVAPWGGVVTSGLQLSLFDVTDMTKPTAIEQLEIGGPGSYADASYSHKAFTFLPQSGLLALPAAIYAKQGETGFHGDFQFAGVLAYQVDATGFTAMGSVGEVSDNFYGYSAWRRAAIAGETLYALTNGGIRAASLSDLDATRAIRFGE